jgi:hypothetical protein
VTLAVEGKTRNEELENWKKGRKKKIENWKK